MPIEKRTKIVCTLGPAPETQGVMEAMIRSGMNVARLNFSHGTHPHHQMLIRRLRLAAKKVEETVGILADLQGPKVRVGILPEKGIKLSRGRKAIFQAGQEEMNGEMIPVPYAGLARDLKRGDQILLDDGLIEVRVEGLRGRIIRTRVITGGILTSHKGLNAPTATLRIPAVTKKDWVDLDFARRAGVDFIALSFVKQAKDLRSVREFLTRRRARRIKIIVKIEKHEAVKNFNEILEAADGIMVARGDLGVELPAEEVPIRQKQFIEKCRLAAKPVIVATQMLDSMIRQPRPTRAEVSDVAAAVVDHTDAVMLSGETATGQYPREAVKMMAKIIRETETSHYDDLKLNLESHTSLNSEALAEVVRLLAQGSHLAAVFIFESDLSLVQKISSLRPELPLILATTDSLKARQSALVWGIKSLILQRPLARAKTLSFIRRQSLLPRGREILVITAEQSVILKI